MATRTTLLFFATLTFSTMLRAAQAVSLPTIEAVFADDLSALDREFAGLEAVENAVLIAPLTRTELAAQRPDLSNFLQPELDLESALLGSFPPRDDRLWKIPGFLWGFCLGGIGVWLVYTKIEGEHARKSEGRKALVGLGFLLAFAGATYVLLRYAKGLRQ